MKTFKELLGTPDHSLDLRDTFYTAKGHIADEAERHLHDNHELNHDEKSSLLTYAKDINTDHLPDSAYKMINHSHRNEGTYPAHKNTLNDYTKHIDSAIAKHTTKNDIHVWRGIAPKYGKTHLDSLEHGDTFSDKGFVSTSVNPGKAIDFGSDFNRNSEGKTISHIARIKIPEGSKALALNNHEVGHKHENEVLLPRNSKFHYDGKRSYKDIRGNTILVHHLTHIPEES